MGDVDSDGFMTYNEFKGMSERLEIPLYTTEVNIRHIKTNSLKICLLKKSFNTFVQKNRVCCFI